MPTGVRLGEDTDLGPLALASDVVLSPDDEVVRPEITETTAITGVSRDMGAGQRLAPGATEVG